MVISRIGLKIPPSDYLFVIINEKKKKLNNLVSVAVEKGIKS